jgi:predicted nucleotidyltransferase
MSWLMAERIEADLAEVLSSDSNVLAMWLEGSRAGGREDEYSDIDLNFMVKDGSSGVVYELIEERLTALGGLDVNYERYCTPKFVRQKVYHIKGSSRFLIIDCNVEEQQRGFVFTRGVDELRVVFDKHGSLKFQDLETRKMEQANLDALREIRGAYYGFRPNVEKQYLRGKFIEAFGYYQRYVLEPLIEVLRIAFIPAKTGYYIKDIYRDLPHEVTTALEELFKVADISEFEQKISQADELFERAVRLINSTRQAHPRS